MRFRTEYKPARAPFTLDPGKRVVMLGSCFADSIRSRMRGCLWCAENPLATLYNPLSIERAIRASLDAGTECDRFRDTVFTDDSGIAHTWLLGSSVSSAYADGCMSKFAGAARCLREGLENAQALFVTFGTSICYFLRENPEFVVANCHKQPAALFVRRRISVEEIVEVWERLALHLRELNPELEIIFTVSPVRHVKDGLEGNARSKAVLLLAVEELCRRLPFCSYFPAYEIMNDDLRDYRFYASDLVHPSEQGVEYIWEVFKETYLDEAGIRLLKEGEKLAKSLAHRQLIATGDQASRMEMLHKKCAAFRAAHPDMLDPLIFM